MNHHQEPDQPRDPHVQIDITLTLPRIAWLLTGIAISHLHTFGSVIEKASLILQALTG